MIQNRVTTSKAGYIESGDPDEAAEKFTLVAVHNDKFRTPELNRAVSDLIRQGRVMIEQVFVLTRHMREPRLSEDQVRIHRGEEAESGNKYILTGWYLGTCVFNTFRNLLQKIPTNKTCEIHIPLETVEDEVLQASDMGSLKENQRFMEVVNKYYDEALKRGDVAVFLDGDILRTSSSTNPRTVIHFYSSSENFLRAQCKKTS